MAARSTRDRNKQLKKRLRGLENKVYQYGELGVDIALIIGYREKEGGYSYTTSEEFLQHISKIRSHPKSINRLPKDIKEIDAQSGLKMSRTIKKRRTKWARRANAPEQLPSETTLGQIVSKEEVKKKRSFFPDPPTLPVLLEEIAKESCTGS